MFTLVDDLVTTFRSDVFDRADVDDAGNPRDTLWSEDDVMRYMNSAVAQWAADTLAYRRNFILSLTGSQPRYRAPFEIIEVVRAALYENNLWQRSLSVFNLDEGQIDDDYGIRFVRPHDLLRDVGTPRGLTLDRDPHYIYIYPAPLNVATPPLLTTVEVNAVVYPQRLYPGMPMPMQNEQDLELVLLWMKKLAYAKQDADVLDLSRSNSFAAEYSARMPTRKHEYDRTVRDGGVVGSSW